MSNVIDFFTGSEVDHKARASDMSYVLGKMVGYSEAMQQDMGSIAAAIHPEYITTTEEAYLNQIESNISTALTRVREALDKQHKETTNE